MSIQDRNCQIPTPEEYVTRMLDYVGYQHNLMGQKVLENSCGEGNILEQIVERYIEDAQRCQYSAEEIATGLEKDITAYEIDPKKVELCKNRLDRLAEEKGIVSVKWNIKEEDFLKSEGEEYQYIIGNPPYITYHNLDDEERAFLKTQFSSCANGRFDYCYAFIEASMRQLADDGKMIYLVPFSIFRNKYASELRILMRDCITKIVDYRNQQVFPGITCSAALILCKKSNMGDTIEYEEATEHAIRVIYRTQLPENGLKWIFQQSQNGNRRLGDYFQVHNSVATLCNKAFLFEVMGEDDDGVEAEMTRPATSTKSQRAFLRNGREYRIIFPYRIQNGVIVHYEEAELQQRYPGAWNHLHRYFDALHNRKSDENAAWFEYGRSQALTEIWREKLVFPMVITHATQAYISEAEAVPYAGYFITTREDSPFTLQNAKEMLESESFYQYAKDVGTPTTTSSYRMSVNDIIEYRF